MDMPKHMSVLVLVYVLALVSCFKFGCGKMVVVGEWNRSCSESEKQALLLLKESLVDDFNYLSSWVGDDCCAWPGIGCNNKTGHVIQLDLRRGYFKCDQISPSLLDLKYLTYLDLSFNNFDGIKIPEFLGSFKDLTYLNLSFSNFQGLVPHHLGNVSGLRHLDLSSDIYDYQGSGSLLSIDSMDWLSKLSLLEHLDLSGVDLSRAHDWFPTIHKLPNSISVLQLHSCHLPNNIPPHFLSTNLTSLITLDLGQNHLNSTFPIWVSNISGLAHLNLESNNFKGPIPKSIGKLTSLTNLRLSYNNFQGPIPHSIGNLTSLFTLDLAFSNLNDLIPLEMGNLTKLRDLFLFSNKLRGSLPESFCRLSKLETLEVSENQLSGSIPKCIGELSTLTWLGLDSNSWEGFVSEHHFVNLTRLTFLDISSKSDLVMNVGSKWVPPFQLEYLHMEQLKVGPRFPQWLLTQRKISTLDMADTSISDTIPSHWFVSLLSQAVRVDLSNTDIINGEQLPLISAAPSDLGTLALSNSSLSGQFPAFTCNLTSLTTLALSNNNFSGKLPQCLGNLKNLEYLDVRNNSLSGDIPVSLGCLGHLTYLNLNNNKFQGKLPLSFRNLKKLKILDVGKNTLSDFLPSWIGEQVPRLRYLILRSNNFYGKIPSQLCQSSYIQILNLAQNQITGNIPPCFGNFTAMITLNNINPYTGFPLEYGELIIDDAKGYELKYTSTLMFMSSIDLSNNNITGEIPEELMDLRGLLNLNLSSNHLVGRIPDRIGKMEQLEYLDLSRNQLNGAIPQSLSDLNFLSRLNLSFNNLSGEIPTGNQLQTLNDPSIYAGNNQLCGRPILKPCFGDSDSHDNEAHSESVDELVWFYAGIGPGLLVGFLGFCASLHFINSWRHSYFDFVDKVFDKIALNIALLQRKFHN